MLEQLRVPFPAAQVKKNQDGLDYVAIDGYINRFLDTLGLDYNFIVTQSTVELLPEDMKTRSGKRQYLATVTAQLTVGEMPDTAVRSGVGADVSHDPDKAVKTAQAEAFKKAAHQFGVALELWDEEHRESLERERKVDRMSDAALKKAVWAVAKTRTGKEKPTVAEVAKAFEVKAGDLSERETLVRIYTENG